MIRPLRAPGIAGLLATPAIALGLAISLLAQSKPDFTGRWTTDPDQALSPAVPGAPAGARAGGQRGSVGDMGSGWGSTITVSQDVNRLTVEYAFFGRGDMQPPLKFVYALDGSETRNTVMMGRGVQVQASTTAWDSDRLVITTVHSFTDPVSRGPATVTVKQTLSVALPTSLVVETTRSGALGGPSSTTRTVYRKI
jgi:hypothetical protein